MLHDVFPSQFVYMALSVLENCPSLVQEGNKDIHHEFGRGDDEIKREQSNSDDSSREQGSALNLDDSREDLEEGEIDEDVDGNNACDQSKDNKKDKEERKRKRRHHKHSEEEDGKDDKSKKKKFRKHHKYEKTYRDHDDISTADFMKAGSPAGPFAGAAVSPTPYDLLLRGAAHSPHENELGQPTDNNCASSSPHVIKPRHRRKSSREKPNHHMVGRVDLRRDRDRRRSDMSPKKVPLCKYYMEGKCQKGDNCPFSHNATPPRKMEVCKFYILDCCAKKDKCLYMHSDFPCKFFHTGAKCFSEGKCKYSHNPLTDITRSILLRQHLETAPKEILGDFPRLTREGAQAIVTTNDNNSPGEANPEKEESEDEKENSLYGDNPSSLREESPSDDQAAHINLNFYRESSLHEERAKGTISGPQNGGGDTGDIENCPKSQFLDITHKVDQESDESVLSVPQHLPKRQRELFIRIQQQQLQRQETSMENSESSKENMERANTPQSPNNENNWYSSEDEDESGENLLSDVLKKLQQNNTSSQVQSLCSNDAMNKASNNFDFDISKINLPTNIANVLSSLKSKSDSDVMRPEGSLLCRNNDSKMCGDVDLRTTPFASDLSHDSDMRQKDTDLRNFFGDTDLRSLQTVKRLRTDPELTDGSNLPSHSDVDLRSESLLGLPFKPIPDHVPCKEIDASLGSHPPIKYRLHTVANRGKPDYSQVKLSGLESRAQSDPRLQKAVPKRRSSSEVTETSQPLPGSSDGIEKPASSSHSSVPSSPVPNPPVSVPVRKVEDMADNLPKINPNDPRLSKIADASTHLITSSEPVERDPRKSKARARMGEGDIHPCTISDPRSNRSEPLLETPILNVNPPGGRCALLPTPNLDPRYIDPSARGIPLGSVHGPVLPHQYYNHDHMGYMGYNPNPNFMPSDDIPVDHWGRGSWNNIPRGRGRGRGRWRGAPKTVYNRTNYSKDNRKVEKEVNWEKEENWDEEEKWDKEEKWDRSEKCVDNVKWANKVEIEERWDEDENWDNDQELKDVFANKDPTASPFV